VRTMNPFALAKKTPQAQRERPYRSQRYTRNVNYEYSESSPQQCGLLLFARPSWLKPEQRAEIALENINDHRYKHRGQ